MAGPKSGSSGRGASIRLGARDGRTESGRSGKGASIRLGARDGRNLIWQVWQGGKYSALSQRWQEPSLAGLAGGKYI